MRKTPISRQISILPTSQRGSGNRRGGGGGGNGGGDQNSFTSGVLSEQNSAIGSLQRHRMSVKSISEVKNVIGAEEIETRADICSRILAILTWMMVIVFFPFSLCTIVNVIQEYERGMRKI